MSKFGTARNAALLMALQFEAQAGGLSPETIDPELPVFEEQEIAVERRNAEIQTVNTASLRDAERRALDDYFDEKDWDKALAQVQEQLLFTR